MTHDTKDKILAKILRLEDDVKELKMIVLPDADSPKAVDAVTTGEDPVLAELWNNPQDAAYDDLATQ